MTEPLVLDQVSSPESPPSHAIRSSEGRGGQRSRTGCWTCRNKKVKCDEHRPICKRCSRLKRECDYAPRTKPRRRRKEESSPTAALVRRNTGASTVSTGSQSAGHLLDGPGSIARNLLSSISTAACSVTLTDDEHEAIRYFRSSFAQMSHTKNPKYSLYSIMFRIAQDEPMVMHMVTALGGREIEFIREKEEPVGSRKAVYHYSSALRMMADAVERENHVSRLDVILTALYLMLVYEQKFGDPSCSALSSHLLGTASILQHRCPGLFLLPSPIKSTPHTSRALTYAAKNPDSNSTVSQYSARLLLWISLIDASAASCGIGGQFNAALFKALSETSSNGGGSQFQPIERFSRMHRYSNPLYRTVWGDSYPQSELLDDVENRNIYALRGECGQLWFMIAQLAALYKTDPEAAEQRATIVEQAIEHVGEKFTELMEVASELSIDTDNSHRLVANIRSIVPYYYASVLDFYRVTKFDEPLGYRQRHALKETMNLAFQSFQYEGDQAMTRIAWPLFVAALETDDLLHRDWVMNRFAGMQKYGRNYERAHKFLVQTVAAQDRLGHRLDMREQLKSGAFDMFVM